MYFAIFPVAGQHKGKQLPPFVNLLASLHEFFVYLITCLKSRLYCSDFYSPLIYHAQYTKRALMQFGTAGPDQPAHLGRLIRALHACLLNQ